MPKALPRVRQVWLRGSCASPLVIMRLCIQCLAFSSQTRNEEARAWFAHEFPVSQFSKNSDQADSPPSGGARSTTPTGGARSTTPTGGARSTTPTGGARFITPTGGVRSTTPTGGARSTTPTGGSDSPHQLVRPDSPHQLVGQIHHTNRGARANSSTPAVLLTCNISKREIRGQTPYPAMSPEYLAIPPPNGNGQTLVPPHLRCLAIPLTGRKAWQPSSQYTSTRAF